MPPLADRRLTEAAGRSERTVCSFLFLESAMCATPGSTPPPIATSLPQQAAVPDHIPQSNCPLLQQLLLEKGLQAKGIYKNKDVAEILGVSTRSVQDWVRCGKLPARDLPGRGRFLSQDLELFLQHSVKTQRGGGR